MDDENKIIGVVGTLALVGSAIGLGQLLASEEQLTWRIIFGRMLSSGGIALVAGFGLQFWPDLSLVAMVGIAAALASLGTSFLEKLVNHFLKR